MATQTIWRVTLRTYGLDEATSERVSLDSATLHRTKESAAAEMLKVARAASREAATWTEAKNIKPDVEEFKKLLDAGKLDEAAYFYNGSEVLSFNSHDSSLFIERESLKG